MRLVGRIEVGPYGADSKSARQHQAFLVTDDGERLLLRRYDGPTLRDAVLEALEGARVEVVGLRRETLFIAKRLRPATAVKARGSGTAPSASGGRARRKS